MADEVTLTPEEKLSELSNSLIQGALLNGEARHLLFSQMNTKVFRDENYIIYSVMYNLKDRGIVPDYDFMKMYLMRSMKFIKESSGQIDINAYSDLDENPLMGYVIGVLKHFTRISQPKDVDLQDYKLSVEKYKVEFSNFEMSKALSQARIMLYDGVQIGNKLFQGYDDAISYVKKKNADIEALLDKTKGEGFIDSRVSAIEDDASIKPTKIGDFGLIKELNEYLGGYFTSVFYNIMAPTKGGKSKFTARAIHNIMVEHGNNVSVWAHEGGYKAFWAQMRAIHYEYLYIRNADENTRIAPLSQKDILFGNYPSEEIKAAEQASRLDLFTNPNYGVLSMIDRPFYVETFIDEIETSVQMNDSKMVLIDYLQLISSQNKNKSKSESIGKAYQDLLAYAKKRNVAVMSPSQFKQEFIKEMAKSGEVKNPEIRTAGGESSEIVRTPDVNIALYASTEDLIRKEMTIMSIPSRLAEPFPNISIYADLCTCLFSSIDTE